jgi:hypothetical protein
MSVDRPEITRRSLELSRVARQRAIERSTACAMARCRHRPNPARLSPKRRQAEVHGRPPASIPANKMAPMAAEAKCFDTSAFETHESKPHGIANEAIALLADAGY